MCAIKKGRKKKEDEKSVKKIVFLQVEYL